MNTCSKVVKDYYETLNEQEELLKGYKFDRQHGKKVKLPEEYDAALHKRLKAAQEQMRKISKMEKSILDNPKLNSDQREEKILELEKKMR